MPVLLQPFPLTRKAFGYVNPSAGELSVPASMQDAICYFQGLTIEGTLWGQLIVAATLS